MAKNLLHQNKLCVYTCLIGGYEDLNEQPIANQSEIPFICFTDDKDLKSNSWKISYIDPTFIGDPARSQRIVKLHPHKYLKEHECSLYIDNSVILKKCPEDLIKENLANHNIAIPLHSFRESVLDEFIAVSTLSLDEPTRIFEQLNHYSLHYPEILEEKPYWAGILFRRHHDEKLQKAMDFWCSQVLRFSKRDQLSLNLALQAFGITPKKLVIDNYGSDFHSWPFIINRGRDKGLRDKIYTYLPNSGILRKTQLELEKESEKTTSLNEQLEQCKKELSTQSEIANNLTNALISAQQKLESKSLLEENYKKRTEDLQKSEDIVKDLTLKEEESVSSILYMKETLEALNVELKQIKGINNLILNSNSWKITKPLRSISEWSRIWKGKLAHFF